MDIPRLASTSHVGIAQDKTSKKATSHWVAFSRSRQVVPDRALPCLASTYREQLKFYHLKLKVKIKVDHYLPIRSGLL